MFFPVALLVSRVKHIGDDSKVEDSFQDIGYFMSPRERSYDALGLMKHVNEHSASVFASAEEVLDNETPKQKSINAGNLDWPNKKSDQRIGTTPKASNVMVCFTINLVKNLGVLKSSVRSSENFKFLYFPMRVMHLFEEQLERRSYLLPYFIIMFHILIGETA